MKISAGCWTAQVTGPKGAEAALSLRAKLFRGGACDRDAFDETARHLTIFGPGGAVACARLTVQTGDEMAKGYTAQFYDLDRFAAHFSTGVELGRMCIAPACGDPNVPRLMLGVTARIVTKAGAQVLYGCSSFPQDTQALGVLASASAPTDWAPRRRAMRVRPLTGTAGKAALPPLLRSYLSLGARVSDHAVVDDDLDTVHVFTGLPVAAIPPSRAKLLTSLLTPA